jgi:hypothetical protein
MEEENMDSELKITYTAIFFALIVMVAIIYLTSCTYSITQVQTRGSASDVVDETATNTPSSTLSPIIRLPAGAIL